VESQAREVQPGLEPLAKVARAAVLAQGLVNPPAESRHLVHERGADGASGEMVGDLGSKLGWNGVLQITLGYFFDLVAIHG